MSDQNEIIVRLQKITKDLEENNDCNQAFNRIWQEGLIHLFKEYELRKL
jgi:hypothetical protein